MKNKNSKSNNSTKIISVDEKAVKEKLSEMVRDTVEWCKFQEKIDPDVQVNFDLPKLINILHQSSYFSTIFPSRTLSFIIYN